MAKSLTIRLFLKIPLLLSWALPQVILGQIMTVDNQFVSVDMMLGPVSEVLVTGDLVNRGTVTNQGMLVIDGNLDNDFRFDNEGSLTIGGNANNSQVFNNTGTMALAGNWTNLASFNTMQGTLILNGAGNQNVANNQILNVANLVINGSGSKTLDRETQVDSLLDLQQGLLIPPAAGMLLVKSAGQALGGTAQSYVDGVMFHEGNGFKYYPLGNSSAGVFAFAILEDVQGVSPVIGMQLVAPNAVDPMPDENLLGVNKDRYWVITVPSGQFSGSIVTLAAFPNDLDDANMGTKNTIAVEVDKSVIAEADDPGGPFTSLGNEGTQNLSAGELTSETEATRSILAIALSPEIPPDGVLFIPNAFVPSSLDPDDNVFKIFGEKVVPDNFSLRIFDNWGLLVYETDDFVEANTLGWNGKQNNTGADLPLGIYTYMVRIQFENGNLTEKLGTVSMLK